MYNFKKEIDAYAPIVNSEGDLTRKDYRILIPYTPENPDRLLKYAIRVPRENDGEINMLRVITWYDDRQRCLQGQLLLKQPENHLIQSKKFLTMLIFLIII